MKYFKVVFVVLMLLLIPQASFAFEGLSGSTWGNLRYDTLRQNPKALGYIRQGVDWFYFRDIKISSYAEFRYRYADLESEFFNAYAPIAGLSFKKDPFRLGWEYSWETLADSGETEKRSEFYIEWYSDWDLKPMLR